MEKEENGNNERNFGKTKKTEYVVVDLEKNNLTNLCYKCE
jgi:hypothetical protein